MDPRRTRRTAVALALTAATGLVLASPAVADSRRSDGPLIRYGTAIPEGATADVHSVATSDGKTIVALHVRGFAPNTEYGAHAHVNACSTTNPLAAGPHFQNVVDPVKPSVDPAYANPDNEIWLDLTTNPAGDGHAKAVVDWQFAPERRAKSVIIHVEHTHTGPNDSGVAGARLACIDMNF